MKMMRGMFLLAWLPKHFAYILNILWPVTLVGRYSCCNEGLTTSIIPVATENLVHTASFPRKWESSFDSDPRVKPEDDECCKIPGSSPKDDAFEEPGVAHLRVEPGITPFWGDRSQRNNAFWEIIVWDVIFWEGWCNASQSLFLSKKGGLTPQSQLKQLKQWVLCYL